MANSTIGMHTPWKKNLPKPENGLNLLQVFTLIKKPIKPDDDIALYAWNQSKKPVYIDDLKIKFTY
jgi:hypothetical protein